MGDRDRIRSQEMTLRDALIFISRLLAHGLSIRFKYIHETVVPARSIPFLALDALESMAASFVLMILELRWDCLYLPDLSSFGATDST